MKENDGHAGETGAWFSVLILLACAFCVVAVVIPNFSRVRVLSCRNACVANLMQMDGAKATWALEHDKKPTDTPLASDLYGPTNYIPEAPSCPQGGIYTVGSVGEKPRCSLSGPLHTLARKPRD